MGDILVDGYVIAFTLSCANGGVEIHIAHLSLIIIIEHLCVRIEGVDFCMGRMWEYGVCLG